MFILEEIVNDLPYKIIFAGSNPSLALRKAITSNSRAELKENLSTEEIHNLVAAAQINLLPTFQATGIKLKLLAALFTGRHCIVNSPMVEHTGIETLCKIGNSPAELKALIKAAMEMELSREEINFRQEVLIGQFSSTSQLKLLMDLIGINHKVAAVAES